MKHSKKPGRRAKTVRNTCIIMLRKQGMRVKDIAEMFNVSVGRASILSRQAVK